MVKENPETALEIIKRVDPNYSGDKYHTRLDFLANFAEVPVHQLRAKLLQAGAEFEDPLDIAPEDYFTLRLKPEQTKEKPKKARGFMRKSSTGGKVGRFLPQDSSADIFGDHDLDVD